MPREQVPLLEDTEPNATAAAGSRGAGMDRARLHGPKNAPPTGRGMGDEGGLHPVGGEKHQAASARFCAAREGLVMSEALKAPPASLTSSTADS